MNSLLLSLSSISSGLVAFLTGALGNVGWQILFNTFGVVAMGIKIFEYQSKSRRTSITICIICCLLWSTYFILQGDFTSAMCNLLYVAMNIVFYQREKHKWANSKFWLFFFLAINLSFGLITFKDWRDVFPLIGTAIATFAYFVINRKVYRHLSLWGSNCWIANGTSKGLIVAPISDTLNTISIIISIIRFAVIERKEKLKEQSDKQ